MHSSVYKVLTTFRPSTAGCRPQVDMVDAESVKIGDSLKPNKANRQNAIRLTIALLVAMGLAVVPVPAGAHGHLFDVDGGLACSPLEVVTGNDHDGDGTVDCEDPDDDNDYLTDRYDIEVIGSNAHLDSDYDNDGILDYLDLLPALNSAVSFEVEGTYEDQSQGNCDLAGSSMERYIQDFDTMTTGASYDMTPPKGWTEDTAPTDPGYAETPLPSALDWVVENPTKSNAFSGSQKLTDWNGVNGITTIGSSAQAPQFHFSISFKENDEFNYDDWIVISGPATTGLFKFAVGAADNVGVLTPDAGDCTAQIKHTMGSSVRGEHVGALLAYQHGDNLVTRDDASALIPGPVM